MKKLVFLALMLLAAASCTPELPQAPDQTETVFHASFADQSDPATKVYMDENWKLRWNADDEISVFNGTVDNLEYRVMNIDDTGRKADFGPVAGQGTGNGSTVRHIYAVYPYNENTSVVSEGTLSLAIPAEQAYYGGNSFGRGASVMLSMTTDNDLVFKNVCGFLELKLYGGDISVTRITLEGAGNEKLAGTATVTMETGGVPSVTMGSMAVEAVSLVCADPVALGADQDNYTSFVLAVPPTTFENGFTITVIDEMGGVYTKTTGRSVTIGRNQVVSMAPLAVEPVYPVWTVVGDFNGWGGVQEDEVIMEQVAPGLWVSPVFTLPASVAFDKGFKVRKDYGWDVNYGGVFVAFGEPFNVYRDGGNIQISQTENYNIRVTFDLTDISRPTITVDNVPAWSVVGSFNDWSEDLFMVETTPGIWVSPEFSTTDDLGFKLRFDKDWVLNLGGSFVTYGESFAGVTGGDNIRVEPGKTVWVQLDYTSPENPRITVFEVEPTTVWSVIGAFNGWAGDVDMTETSPGIWESPSFATSGGEANGFKIRKDHSWEYMDYGGVFGVFGTAFAAVKYGDPIWMGSPDQEYILTVTLDLTDPDNPLITVRNVSVWSVIGSFSGWAEDLDLVETESGIWQGVLTNCDAGTEFKFRKNHDWNINLGHDRPETLWLSSSVTFGLSPSGGNLGLLEGGSFQVVLNLNEMTATVTRLP